MVTTERVDLVSVSEAAQLLGTTRGQVHYHRLYGRLPSVLVPRQGGRDMYLIPRASVEQLRRERATRIGNKQAGSR
jgi:hypothetical protein